MLSGLRFKGFGGSEFMGLRAVGLRFRVALTLTYRGLNNLNTVWGYIKL